MAVTTIAATQDIVAVPVNQEHNPETTPLYTYNSPCTVARSGEEKLVNFEHHPETTPLYTYNSPCTIC
ncbi:hypothetical protein JCM8547_007986 [Rhodosporidiobolus lusitaniae]